MKKALYKMKFDSWRTIEAVFIADKEYVEYLNTHDIVVDFGAADGEYTNVTGQVYAKFLTDDEMVISIVEELGLECGENPLYLDLGEDTSGLEETGIDWSCRTVKEYIDYKLHGKIPK